MMAPLIEMVIARVCRTIFIVVCVLQFQQVVHAIPQAAVARLDAIVEGVVRR